MAVPYMVSEKWLDLKQYINLLETVNLNKCISTPIYAAKPGQLFIYSNPEKKFDWKADQYRWKVSGKKLLPISRPTIMCRYCTEYHGALFYKRVYNLIISGTEKDDLTLIHYVGSLDGVIQSPHGNRKHNLNTPFIRTAPSVIEEQKTLLNKPPHKTYKMLKMETENIPSCILPVLSPRDGKQVTNTVLREREKKLPSRDDIIGIMLLNDELEGFIKKFVLIPEFYCIFASDETLNYFKSLCNSHPEKIQLFYDTTFNLGDFYISVLLYTHPLFHGNPVIPVAFIMHHLKTANIHRDFFNFIRSICPEIDGKIIITDREAGIVQAIKLFLPKTTHFFCWNHIRQDVAHWLKARTGYGADDVKIYGSWIYDLLNSASESDFEEKLNTLKTHWTPAFTSYFNKHIYSAIKSSGKWILLQYNNIYKAGSGITINAAESFNAVLKRLMERQEVKAQVFIIQICALDNYYYREIITSFANIGNYKLMDEYLPTYAVKPENLPSIKTKINLKNAPYVFENKDNTDKNDNLLRLHTTYSIAKLLLEENKITLVPQQSAFIVTSLDGKKSHCVKLFPTEYCTCSMKQSCVHISGAKMAIGWDVQPEEQQLKLQKILRRKRGLKSGRKGDPKRIRIVASAPDSERKGDESIAVPYRIGTESEKSSTKYKIFDIKLKAEGISELSETLQTSFNNKLESVVTSTPKFNPKSVSNEETQITGLYDTFSEKINKNKSFSIFGRNIYPTHLDNLSYDKNDKWKATDLYLIDAVVDVYIPILIHEEKTKYNVTIYAASIGDLSYVTDDILNNTENFNHIVNGLSIFLRNKIPNYDIVFFPFIVNSHYGLIIVLRKEKLIIYLDSLRKEVPSTIIRYLNILYAAYDAYLQRDKQTFRIITPQDIPLQKNSYDCGLYCLLYSEILIRRDLSLLQYTENSDMRRYREVIKSKILQYMKVPIPGVYIP